MSVQGELSSNIGVGDKYLSRSGNVGLFIVLFLNREENEWQRRRLGPGPGPRSICQRKCGKWRINS
jgi:hypothetical protein